MNGRNSLMPGRGTDDLRGSFLYSGINRVVTRFRRGGVTPNVHTFWKEGRIQSPFRGEPPLPAVMKNTRSLSSSSGHDRHRSGATPAGGLPQPAGVM